MCPLRSVYAQPAQNATLALAKRVQQPCARACARAATRATSSSFKTHACSRCPLALHVNDARVFAPNRTKTSAADAARRRDRARATKTAADVGPRQGRRGRGGGRRRRPRGKQTASNMQFERAQQRETLLRAQVVREAPGKGFGAFATKAFEADVTVADYVGERLDQRDAKRPAPESKRESPARLQKTGREEDGSRRRRGRDVDGRRTGRGAAAAATWIFRGGARQRGRPAKRDRSRRLAALECRRRSGRAAEYPRGSRGGAATRPRTIQISRRRARRSTRATKKRTGPGRTGPGSRRVERAASG